MNTCLYFLHNKHVSTWSIGIDNSAHKKNLRMSIIVVKKGGCSNLRIHVFEDVTIVVFNNAQFTHHPNQKFRDSLLTL